MNRASELDKLQQTREWDIIIIGGGATGLGVAVDASSRGFKTILVEAVDFAKGTSSRSTKLAHGGVRYLEQFNFGLVKEALKERGLMLQNAGHLASNLTFVIPNYNWFDSAFYTFGLKFYDMMSGSLSLGSSKYISNEETIRLLPNINQNNLKSGVVYHDGQFDDARLAINLAQTANENSACVLNYSKVTALLKDQNHQIIGVKIEDAITGKHYEIKGKSVINATGVFTNAIMKMNDKVYKKYIVPSQGIHLVFDQSFLPTKNALMIPKTSDGRVLFAIPWHNKTLVGTTDKLMKSHSLEPIATESEIDFIMENAQHYLSKKPQRSDVLSVFAGLRPLSAPKEKGMSTKEVSRSHKIIVSETGLITITGGKWTTYRKMAEEIVDKAIVVHNLPKSICKTENLSIHGNQFTNDLDRENHLYVYGSDAKEIVKLQENRPELKEKLHPKYPYTLAEVVWAIQHEMAVNLEDVLARRVRLLFLDARVSMECAEKVCDVMAKELGHHATWKENQLSAFRKLANGYLISDY